MRQPPEKVDVARSDAASSNPRPWRILEARAGAPAASMACNRAPMAPRRAAPSPVSAPAAIEFQGSSCTGEREGGGVWERARAHARARPALLRTFLLPSLTLRRTAIRVQSNAEKRPPHTAKEPPMRGASRRTA